MNFYSIISSPYTFLLCILSLIYLFRKQILYYIVTECVIIAHDYQKARRPKRIILVRHGNSVANNNYDILQEIPDNKIHLSEKGIEQAKLAGKKLKEIVGDESIQFYVSPYRRTKETYKYILESLKDNQSDCTISSVLREQEYGNLQNDMDKQFKEQKLVGEYYYRFKNGESGSDVAARMAIFLQYLFRRILSIDYHTWDNIIIVSHCLTIKFFMMVFLNKPVKDYQRMKNLGNAEFWIIEKNEKGKYKVKDDIFNEEKETNKNIGINKNENILENIENIVEDKENKENVENLESLENIIEDKENK